MAKKIFIATIFVILIFSAIPNAYSTEKQYIGILPYYAPDKIWHFYKPFINHLNKTTDISWELKLYHNYDAIIDGICSGEISIAYLGPNPFGLAYEKCRVKPLLVILGDDEKPFYRSIIFTGNRSINAVASNEVAAGATKVSVFEKFKGLKFKKLKTSEPLPHHSFCAAPGTNPDIERKFINALSKLKPLHNKRDKDMVKDWDPELRYGFVLPPKNYVQGILKLHTLFKKYND